VRAGRPDRSAWTSQAERVWVAHEPPATLRAAWAATMGRDLGQSSARPWELLLSRTVQASEARSLGLPSGLPANTLVAAVRGAESVGNTGRLARLSRARALPDGDDARIAAYLRLSTSKVTKANVARFLEGYANDGSDQLKDKAALANSALRKDVGRARGRLERAVLIPMRTHAQPERKDFETWLLMWLVDGRADVALWLALGSEAAWFRWGRADRQAKGPATGATVTPLHSVPYAEWVVGWGEVGG
jgi:hypothetical protein